jgi:osmotically-inducible protein OsmY
MSLPEKTDERVQDEVLDELRQRPVLDVANIAVTVERGIVTLGGHVPNAAQRQMVEDIAQGIPGVRAVVDDVEVRPLEVDVQDEGRLALAALDALDWGVGVPDGRVQVVVHDGRVRLEGTVDRPQERDAAEAAVCDVLGRGPVENAIALEPGASPKPTEGEAGDVPGGEDDFDTLRIDPAPGGKAMGRDEGRPRPGHAAAISAAAGGHANWLDE